MRRLLTGGVDIDQHAAAHRSEDARAHAHGDSPAPTLALRACRCARRARWRSRCRAPPVRCARSPAPACRARLRRQLGVHRRPVALRPGRGIALDGALAVVSAGQPEQDPDDERGDDDDRHRHRPPQQAPAPFGRTRRGDLTAPPAGQPSGVSVNQAHPAFPQNETVPPGPAPPVQLRTRPAPGRRAQALAATPAGHRGTGSSGAGDPLDATRSRLARRRSWSR